MTINWANLIKKDRVKAFGVPWTEEEAQAVFTFKIPAAYVRSGVLTVEAYEEAKAKDEKAGTTIERLPTGETVRAGDEGGVSLGPITVSVSKKKGTKKK